MRNLYFIAAVLEILAITLWAGGLSVLGFLVAPALFQTASSRTEAGRMFGLILKRFHYVSYACGAALFLALALHWASGYRLGAPELVRAAIAVVMLGMALYSGLVLTREIETLRTAVANVPKADARREQFNALHRRSTTLLVFQVLLGLALAVMVAVRE